MPKLCHPLPWGAPTIEPFRYCAPRTSPVLYPQKLLLRVSGHYQFGFVDSPLSSYKYRKRPLSPASKVCRGNVFPNSPLLRLLKMPRNSHGPSPVHHKALCSLGDSAPSGVQVETQSSGQDSARALGPVTTAISNHFTHHDLALYRPPPHALYPLPNQSTT